MTTLLLPHGLGDVIQALPSLSLYAARHGPLTIGVLERLPACAEVVASQPWCEQVLPLPDPWRHPPADTWDGYWGGVAAIEAAHPGATYVHTRRPTYVADPAWSKAVRVAVELGVDPTPTRPVLALDPAEVAAGDLWARLERPAGERLALIHGESGNPTKDVSGGALRFLASAAFAFETSLRPGAPDDRPTHAVALPLRDPAGAVRSVAFHAGALAQSDLFVGIDSGPAHLASVVARNVLWVFTATPVEQALPLYRDIHFTTMGPHRFDLMKQWEGWRASNRKLCGCEVTGWIGGGL